MESTKQVAAGWQVQTRVEARLEGGGQVGAAPCSLQEVEIQSKPDGGVPQVPQEGQASMCERQVGVWCVRMYVR